MVFFYKMFAVLLHFYQVEGFPQTQNIFYPYIMIIPCFLTISVYCRVLYFQAIQSSFPGAAVHQPQILIAFPLTNNTLIGFHQTSK